MHELAITRYIVKTVSDAFDPETMEAVSSIKILMGDMRDYEAEWLQKYFDGLTEGTPLHGAELVINRIPISFKCRECGNVFTADMKAEGSVGCPACGSLSYDLKSGKEFLIDSVTAVMKE